MKDYTMFVGLDVHKDSIEIAVAEEGRDAEVRTWGRIGGDLASLEKAVRKLQSKGCTLRFVYEAGPCGYTIYRYLVSKGLDCAVVAPSMIPRRPGDRVKTDRRDAENLARLHRAGELSPVYVPQQEDEAVRDLIRARKDAKNAQRVAKQQLKAFLLRNGISYEGKSSWTPAHMRRLSEITLPSSAQQIAFQEYLDAVQTAGLRVERLTKEIVRHVEQWRMKPVVDAFQALRGVQMITAATMVAELGDISRFANPRQLMGYLGLVPSEHSSGNSTHRGSITKTGNIHARTALVEASWQYRLKPRVSRIILLRQEKLPKKITDIAWKAQLRLSHRFRLLSAKGKPQQKIVIAVARELAGFMWAIARETPVS
jgi:transposase